MKYYLKILFFGTIIGLISFGCKHSENSDTTSYFGGQIVNPKSSKVYFLKNEKYLDSSLLNKDNIFSFSFKNLDPGLYTFSHGNEYQYVFFEKSDSIIIRLNTWDFDESLVFSGKGAERNNFLMNLFLKNEKEDKLFEPFFNLNPKAFEAKIDSVYKQKITLFKQFKANTTETSAYYKKLVNVAISYPLYRKKENYQFYDKQKLKSNNNPKPDSTFYAYRDKINLNDNSLIYFYPYRNYIFSFFHHNAYKKKASHPESNIALNIMEDIAKSIKGEELKNFYLYMVVSNSYFRYNITYALTDSQRKKALDIFFKNCTNKEMLAEIKQLDFDYNNIKKNAKLFDFKVINTDGVALDASSIYKGKKTVLYFWSKKLINANNLSKRILYLQKQYPRLNFVGINIDDSKGTWLKSAIFKNLVSKNQFQLTQKCVMRNFITAKTPRIILLNNNAIVKNGFTVLWAEDFNKELDLLQKN
ncbi:MAG: hypothetical protein L3J45_00110 [Flavobacteriaceae bacterium]|nr:hypothetical protein [Flavobacteriaceae bacterium]